MKKKKTRSTSVIAKKNQEIADKNVSDSEDSDKVVIATPVRKSKRVVSKELFKDTAADEESSEPEEERNTQTGKFDISSPSKKLRKNEDTEISKSKSADESENSLDSTEKKLSSSSPKKLPIKQKSISSSSGKNEAVETRGRTGVGSPARFSESSDEELSAIKKVVDEALSLDTNEKPKTIAKGRGTKVILVSEDSAGDDEMDESPDKTEPKKASKRAETREKQLDATDTDSDDKERSITSRNKGGNVEASPKRSKKNIPENEKDPSPFRKRKTKAKNSQLNESSASEDSAVEDEVGESSNKKECGRAIKRAKTRAKQLDATDSESGDEEVSTDSAQKPRDEIVGAPLKRSKANQKTNAKEQAAHKKRETNSKKSKLSSRSNSRDNAVVDKKSRLRDKVKQKSEEKKNQNSESERGSSSEEEEKPSTPIPSLVKIKREYPCFACNEMFNKTKDLFDHTCKGKKEKGFICKVCKKVYNLRSSYMTHRFIHSKAKPYKCGECGNRSANQSNHVLHMQREHPEYLPFPCGPCDCSFSSQRELVSHNKMVHNANRCKYCEEKFDSPSKLLRHRFKEHERYLKNK